jgi:hypothetical protein
MTSPLAAPSSPSLTLSDPSLTQQSGRLGVAGALGAAEEAQRLRREQEELDVEWSKQHVPGHTPPRRASDGAVERAESTSPESPETAAFNAYYGHPNVDSPGHNLITGEAGTTAEEEETMQFLANERGASAGRSSRPVAIQPPAQR